MSNILLLGVGPLPVDDTSKLYAPGLRTWHLAQLLAKHGHYVVLGTIEFGDFHEMHVVGFQVAKREELARNISRCRLRFDPVHTPVALRTLHLAHDFSCIVSTTDIMNSIAARIPVARPLWLDYNGDPFTEKQLQASVYNNDASLLPQWEMMLTGLLSGDRFSTASTPQKFAMIGQLGLAGRLNQFTSGEELVHVLMPCSRVMNELAVRKRVQVKARLVPADCFMVLWTGGYNSWCDPETLFHGLEAAMRQNSRIFYVTTGGEIGGHNTESFDRFRKLAEQSEFAARFHFAGWIPTEEVASYYAQADVALNVDAYTYEGEIGYRNRIIDWMGFGTPIITTALCELARMLEARDLVTSFEIGNPQSLCDAILAVAADPEKAREKAKKAKQFLETELVGDEVFTPLLEWADNPCFAGDRQFAAQAGAEALAQRKPAKQAAEEQLEQEIRRPNCGVADFHRRMVAEFGTRALPQGKDSLFTRAVRKLSRIASRKK